MYQIIHILNAYSGALGQKINLTKSGLICGKYLPPQKKNSLATILHMRVWDSPGKYLGLPGDWGRSKNGALQWLRERIFNKLEGWKENLLNQVGKEVLIKAIIQAVPTYTMSIVRFPQNFCNSICSRIAKFWWRGNGRDRGMHWKAWDSLTVSKREGGMGFKDFNIMNSAHLAKQAWRAIKNPNALWVVLQSIYFQGGDLIRAKRARNDSWVWASLIHGKDTLMKHARWLVGKGEQISITQDNWLAYGERITTSTPLITDKVGDLIDDHNAGWNVPFIRTLFDTQTVLKILQTPLSWFQGEDTL